MLRPRRSTQLTQKNGEWPAAIHNNYIVGADNKRQRFQNISMWMVRPDLTCRPFPRYLPAMAQPPLTFIIKVRARAPRTAAAWTKKACTKAHGC